MQMRIQCNNKDEPTSTTGMLFSRHIIFGYYDYPFLLPGTSLLYSREEILSYCHMPLVVLPNPFFSIDIRYEIQEVGWKLATASAILESWALKLCLCSCFLPSPTYTQKISKLVHWNRPLRKQCKNPQLNSGNLEPKSTDFLKKWWALTVFMEALVFRSSSKSSFWFFLSFVWRSAFCCWNFVEVLVARIGLASDQWDFFPPVSPIHCTTTTEILVFMRVYKLSIQADHYQLFTETSSERTSNHFVTSDLRCII